MAPSLSPLSTGRRYLSLALPFLSTDRIWRERLGRSWRSAGRDRAAGLPAPARAPGRDAWPRPGLGPAGEICDEQDGPAAPVPAGLARRAPHPAVAMAASDPGAGAIRSRLVDHRDNDVSPQPTAPRPLVIAAKIRSALRIVALDEAALRLGLEPDQPLADARAMVPALDAADANEAADAALLEAIADWAERYTPLVAIDDQGLMLDVTGCAHLFGGEAALVADLLARLLAQGFAAGAAIADTPGAAFAVARFGGPPVIGGGEVGAVLAPLPLAALRLDPETVSALDRVGLKRIGQILDAPRAPLADRFGLLLLRRLDQALGREEEPIGPRRPVAPLIAERRFAEPIATEDDIAATLLSLAGALAGSLAARDEGARRYELSLFRVDGAVRRIAVGASRPVRSPELVLDLFREKFAGLAEAIDAGFGFDMLRLTVSETAALAPAQTDLAGDPTGEADLDRLIDRIGARLGTDRVRRIAHGDSHIPERAEIRLPASAPPPLPSGAPHLPPEAPPDRPLRLFAKPEPVEATAAVPDGPPVHFRWRRALYRVARAEGPERIAPEWQRGDDDFTRDYFRVEDASGHRFWLFREGLYGRETLTPRWYLHGVFG